MNITLTVRLPEELIDRLDVLCEETKRTKRHHIKKALEDFIENREDYLLCVARLEENNPTIPLSKLRKDLGLD